MDFLIFLAFVAVLFFIARKINEPFRKWSDPFVDWGRDLFKWTGE